MQFKIFVFLVVLIFVVLVDFKVFCGECCVVFDVGGCGVSCIFMNNFVFCVDVDNLVNFYILSDVFGCGGVCCEGCDWVLLLSEWHIIQFEINNKQICIFFQEYWGGMEDFYFSKGF